LHMRLFSAILTTRGPIKRVTYSIFASRVFPVSLETALQRL
jgi:hypothetical protein